MSLNVSSFVASISWTVGAGGLFIFYFLWPRTFFLIRDHRPQNRFRGGQPFVPFALADLVLIAGQFHHFELRALPIGSGTKRLDAGDEQEIMPGNLPREIKFAFGLGSVVVIPCR